MQGEPPGFSRGEDVSKTQPGGGSLLVIDVGTSTLRAAIVRPDASIEHTCRVGISPATPASGLVEFDAQQVADAVEQAANAALSKGGPVAGVGIANQRSTTVVWERSTGRPVAPAIGWQDLRTVGTCLELQEKGFRAPPNASATKLAAILDMVDPGRDRAGDDLCFGTIDTWVAWTLSGGVRGAALHVTDATNAAVTSMVSPTTLNWDSDILDILGIPASMMPTIVDSCGVVGEALILDGAPPICGIAGDQQASLIGQGCTVEGAAKVTLGTGGMLDMCTGENRPERFDKGPAGTFPIVAWQRGGTPVWGVEAVMLSAGSCIEWLRDDLGFFRDASESESLASTCTDTGDVWFVPSLLGIGTPVWDFGARGTLLGLTRGTGRPEVTRAVLEGVAHRSCDLLEASENDTGLSVRALRIDGGMSANSLLVTAISNYSGRPVEVSPVLEATTLGAGFLAGIAVGTWNDESDAASAFTPARRVEPTIGDSARSALRQRWLDARSRAEKTIPELSGITF